MKSLHH